MEKRKVEVTRVFRELYNLKETSAIVRGGARSSKSYSTGQLMCQKFVSEPNVKILIMSKTMPALKITAYKLMLDLLKEYGYYQYCEHNKTDKTLIYKPTGTYILFASLDDSEKIKSTEWNYIWLEEATRFLYNDYLILKTRLSAPAETKNHIYLTFNPVSALHWIKIKIIDREDDYKEIVSTYKDNPYLSEDYIKIIESTAKLDYNYWKVYGLGLWGSLEGLIFNKWNTIKKIPIDYAEKDAVYGIDWGYVHPTAVVKVIKDDNKMYFKEILYESKLTNADVMAKLEKLIPQGARLYADCAEPARIEELRRNGFSIRPSIKGKNSVKDSIDFIKRHEVYITEDSPNLIKELESYKWREDRDGNAMDEPVAINDDAIAAARYAAYSGFAHPMDLTFITSGE